MDGLDGDSLDEGLGDTFSDETEASPVPNMHDQAIINSVKSPHHEKDQSKYSSILKDEKEKTSRIACEKV